MMYHIYTFEMTLMNFINQMAIKLNDFNNHLIQIYPAPTTNQWGCFHPQNLYINIFSGSCFSGSRDYGASFKYPPGEVSKSEVFKVSMTRLFTFDISTLVGVVGCSMACFIVLYCITKYVSHQEKRMQKSLPKLGEDSDVSWGTDGDSLGGTFGVNFSSLFFNVGIVDSLSLKRQSTYLGGANFETDDVAGERIGGLNRGMLYNLWDEVSDSMNMDAVVRGLKRYWGDWEEHSEHLHEAEKLLGHKLSEEGHDSDRYSGDGPDHGNEVDPDKVDILQQPGSDVENRCLHLELENEQPEYPGSLVEEYESESGEPYLAEIESEPEIVVVSNSIVLPDNSMMNSNHKSKIEEPQTGPLMDLFEINENISISTRAQKILVQISDPITSSKIVFKNEKSDGESNNENDVPRLRVDTSMKSFSLPQMEPAAASEPDRMSLGQLIQSFEDHRKLKDVELKPSLRAIVTSNKMLDPSDYFEESVEMGFDFEDLAAIPFSKEKFGDDVNPMIPERIRMFRYLITNEYEGDNYGLLEYVDEIKSHIEYFMSESHNPEYSVDLIYLVRDIFTYSEHGDIDHQILKRFIESLVELTDIVPISTINSTLIITLISFSVKDFTTLFLEYVSVLGSMMVQAFKYYLCFNKGNENDRRSLINSVSEAMKLLDLNDNMILEELVDIYIIFREYGHSPHDLKYLYSSMEEFL